MNKTLKSILLWFLAFIFTAGAAIWQRMSGPTYPVNGTVIINNQPVKFRLIRTYDGNDDATVSIVAPDTAIKGELTYRRFKSFDNWTILPMTRTGEKLTGKLPHQDAAGKVMYQVTLFKDGKSYLLNAEPAVLRYKGLVPLGILIPHIIIIFLGMLFSTRTGLEVVFKGSKVYLFSWITLICLFLGGMILGPLVQKYAFDAYWTGWPFGKDLTDNKSLAMIIFWVVAVIVLRKHRENKLWPIVAAIVLWIVFLIPHSMLGSEIDYTKGNTQIQTTK
jgi:hypothetical protein